MYTIIEDCSPYYIRFKWDGLADLIQFIAEQPLDRTRDKVFKTYAHCNFAMDIAGAILDKLPMKNAIKFKQNRAGMFITNPGAKSSIHKDGQSTRFGLNIPISILDNVCETRWYTDESLKDGIRADEKFARAIHSTERVTCIKAKIFQPNECVLFNTDIWHLWDNSKSTNYRFVLTLRPESDDIYFDDAKKILFEI
jgi:hypothetical protein